MFSFLPDSIVNYCYLSLYFYIAVFCVLWLMLVKLIQHVCYIMIMKVGYTVYAYSIFVDTV